MYLVFLNLQENDVQAGVLPRTLSEDASHFVNLPCRVTPKFQPIFFISLKSKVIFSEVTRINNGVIDPRSDK